MFLFGGISGAFLCVPACFFWYGFPVFFVVFFLVSFGDFAGGIFCAFPGAFFTVFWCFFPCIFSCLSLFFSIYASPWWWSCFSPCFFSWFLGVFSVLFFVLFVVFFFVSFIVLFSCIFSHVFRVFFFVPWVAPKTNNHNILHFGPCFFRCFFWWSLLVKIGYTQYIIYIYTDSYMFGRSTCYKLQMILRSMWPPNKLIPNSETFITEPAFKFPISFLCYRSCPSFSNTSSPLFLQGASEVCGAFVTGGRGLYCLGPLGEAVRAYVTPPKNQQIKWVYNLQAGWFINTSGDHTAL